MAQQVVIKNEVHVVGPGAYVSPAAVFTNVSATGTNYIDARTTTVSPPIISGPRENPADIFASHYGVVIHISVDDLKRIKKGSTFSADVYFPHDGDANAAAAAALRNGGGYKRNESVFLAASIANWCGPEENARGVVNQTSAPAGTSDQATPCHPTTNGGLTQEREATGPTNTSNACSVCKKDILVTSSPPPGPCSVCGTSDYCMRCYAMINNIHYCLTCLLNQSKVEKKREKQVSAVVGISTVGNNNTNVVSGVTVIGKQSHVIEKKCNNTKV